MNNIKTYESFLDFFKKKTNSNIIYLYDLKDCLHELSDEKRIDSSLNNDRLLSLNNYFLSNDYLFGIKPNLSFDNEYENIFSDLHDYVRGNIMLVKFYYKPSSISNEEVKEILYDCYSKLSFYDCKTSFFVDGKKENKSVDDLFKVINSTLFGMYDEEFYISMKIVSPSEILID